MKARIVSTLIGGVLFPSLCVARQSVAYASDNAPYRAGLLSWEAPAYPFFGQIAPLSGTRRFPRYGKSR